LQCLAGLRIAAGDDDPVTLARGSQGGGPANSSKRAGNQNDIAGHRQLLFCCAYSPL
jgi:hypothetical protein